MTSSAPPAETLAPAIREHWSVENSMHRVMDMTFRDDESQARTGDAPANFATIRHMALSLIRTRKDKLSVKANRKATAWSDDHLIRRRIARPIQPIPLQPAAAFVDRLSVAGRVRTAVSAMRQSRPTQEAAALAPVRDAECRHGRSPSTILDWRCARQPHQNSGRD